MMEEKTMKELRALARNRRIKCYYRMPKKELIEALERMKNIPEGVPALNEAKLDKWLDSLEGIPTILKREFKDWLNNNLVIQQKRKDPYECPHGNLKYFCKVCVGSQICLHNKQKSFCESCGGYQIYEHKKQELKCRDC